MKGKLGKLLAGITTVVALSVGGMSALPAHAGTNGQQFDIYDANPNIASVCIHGYNQYNQHTYQCIGLTYGSTTWDNNWWWQGYVFLDYFSSQGTFIRTDIEQVPGWQWPSDWWDVFAG